MDEWRPSETNPGYIEKEIQCGAATVLILRPVLDKAEQAKRENHVAGVLRQEAKKYFKRQATQPAVAH